MIKRGKNSIILLVTCCLIAFNLIGCSAEEDEVANNDIEQSETVQDIEGSDVQEEEEKSVSEYAVIDSFIEQYNEIADYKMKKPIEIDIHSDKYYRTEFRLNAFSDAVAKQCKVGRATIDIVNYGALENDEIRMYLNTDNQKLAISVFDSAMKVLKPSISNKKLKKAHKKIKERTTGEYIGDICYFYLPPEQGLFIECTNIKFYTK